LGPPNETACRRIVLWSRKKEKGTLAVRPAGGRRRRDLPDSKKRNLEEGRPRPSTVPPEVKGKKGAPLPGLKIRERQEKEGKQLFLAEDNRGGGDTSYPLLKRKRVKQRPPPRQGRREESLLFGA